MTRGFILLSLLLLTSAPPAPAADTDLEIASIDQGRSLHKRTAFSPPAVTERTEYYELKGNCEKDLVSQMRQKGPRWNDGRQYDSLTTWYVSWDYDYSRASRTCTADSFRATIDIIFRYPKWVQTNDAPRQLADKWDTYIKNLCTHEVGHRDIVVQEVAELTRAVADMPPAPSCAELDRQVKILCRERMDILDAAEKEYDADTNHGLKQGAIFR